MDHDLALLSPEKSVLTYRLAGLGSRIQAHIIDLLVVAAATYAFLVLGALLNTYIDQGLATFVVALAASLPIFLYFILLEGMMNGQTLGKRAFGIRVRMADGTPVTFTAALGRNLMRPADMLPGMYLVGIVAMFTGPKSQRIGDLVADTVVVAEKRGTLSFTPSPHAAGLHRMEQYVGELRGMTFEEYSVLRSLCDRYPELTPEMQQRLMEEVWTPISRRYGVPSFPNVHPLYMAEATVMKYGRNHGML